MWEPQERGSEEGRDGDTGRDEGFTAAPMAGFQLPSTRVCPHLLEETVTEASGK